MIEPDVERDLRDVFRSRAATVPPPVEPYQGVRRRERQRHAVLGSALAVLLVVAASVGAGLALRPDAPSGGGPDGHQPAGPVAGGTSRSLAGDQALLAEARQVALATKLTGQDAVDPGSVRVPYAEQLDGYTVVLVVGRGLHEDYAAVFLGRAPGQTRLTVAGGTSFYSGQLTAAGRAGGAGFLDPMQVLSVVTVKGRDLGVAIFPRGSRATINLGTTLRADCTLAPGRATNLPLTDGAALFAVSPGSNPYLTVTDRSGRPLVKRALGAVDHPDDPANGQAAAQIVATMRGDAPANDVAAVASFARQAIDMEITAAERPSRYVGIWAGELPGGQGTAALMGAQYASGAIALTGQVTQGTGGPGYGGWSINECLPGGRLSTLLLAERLFDGPADPPAPVIMIGPPTATRAELDFGAAGTFSAQLAGGGGLVAHPGTLVRVTFFDKDGHPLGTARPHPGPFRDLPH